MWKMVVKLHQTPFYWSFKRIITPAQNNKMCNCIWPTVLYSMACTHITLHCSAMQRIKWIDAKCIRISVFCIGSRAVAFFSICCTTFTRILFCSICSFSFSLGWHGARWLVFIFHNISQNGYYWSEVKWILCVGHVYTTYIYVLKCKHAKIGNWLHQRFSYLFIMCFDDDDDTNSIQYFSNTTAKMRVAAAAASARKKDHLAFGPNQFTMYAVVVSHPSNVYVPYVCSFTRTFTPFARTSVFSDFNLFSQILARLFFITSAVLSCFGDSDFFSTKITYYIICNIYIYICFKLIFFFRFDHTKFIVLKFTFSWPSIKWSDWTNVLFNCLKCIRSIEFHLPILIYIKFNSVSLSTLLVHTCAIVYVPRLRQFEIRITLIDF